MPSANGTRTENVLHSFGNGTDGSGIVSGLVFDGTGNLYGTTYGGGSSTVCGAQGCGIVFELSPSSGGWTEAVIYSFCSASGSSCADGFGPMGGVVIDSMGNLFGTTFAGGDAGGNGAVFELSPGNGGAWTEKVLHAFQGGSTDGTNPVSGVIFDSAGNLYGTTEFGYVAVGINNGIVFELSPGSGGQWKESIVYGFCASPSGCSDGATSTARVIFDKDGNLYGTATGGGNSYGVVFALTPGVPGGLWSESPLYSFQGGLPTSGLVMDADGTLYGVAGEAPTQPA